MIYHCGAMVNHLKGYVEHRAANVNGTLEIIRLAVSSSHKMKINYISTLSVQSVKGEEDCYQSMETTNGYVQSKWVAEKIMQQAKESGLSVTIFRPGMISWCTTTGCFNEQDWLYRLFAGLIHIRVAPDINSYLDLTPVDYVSKKIVQLGQQSRIPLKSIYAIHNKNKMITFKSIWCTICRTINPMRSPEYVELNVWKGKLLQMLNNSNNIEQDNLLNGLLLFDINGFDDDAPLNNNNVDVISFPDLIDPVLFAQKLIQKTLT
ncbi:unnamed protein product [Didymodactylos carnosus]|nr:unnamed protein product [Didymodactylos carnosus]CAF4148140.1 unnamed protein product [Didymodactylos carnosus]